MEAGAALSGVRVLELDLGVAQYAGKLLADMGAEVIKIEPLEGTPARKVGPFYHGDPHKDRSLHFWHYNTSKRSITLDFSQADGQEIFKKLAGRADIVLDGLGVGVMASYNIGYERLREEYPELVYCCVTPFGLDGPWTEYRSSDLVSLGLGGPMSAIGYDDVQDTPPIAPAGGQAAHVSSMIAAIGILGALTYRAQGGEGQLVDVSTHEALAVSTEMSIPYWEYQQVNVTRQTGRHARPDVTPPWNHQCLDGKFFSTLPLYLDDKRFAAMVEWFDSEGMAEDLADDRYSTDDHRSEEMHHIIDVISRFCANHTSEYMFQEAQKRRLPWGPINAPDELYHDPHLADDREVFTEVNHEEIGEMITYPGAPYKFMGTPWNVSRRPPKLGEHTREVLGEVGLDGARFNLLSELGVV